MSQVHTTDSPASRREIEIRLIERRSAAALSYEAFCNEYVARNRPVIVQNAVPEWNALRRWTPEFFKQNFGSRTVEVTYGVKMPFAELIDAVLASTVETPGPYLHKVIIYQHLPELLIDLTPENPYSFPRRYCSPLMPKRFYRPDGYLKLLFGGPGGRFPLVHFDSDNAHAMITEIYGDKEFILFSPQDTPNLYPHPGSAHTSQIENIGDPDLDRFPRLRNATEYRDTIHPGEAIFIPCGWWHSAQVVTTSISVCANMLDDSNWDGFVVESCQSQNWFAPATLAKRLYLHAAGTLMSTAETLQRHRLWHAKQLSFLAPISSGLAPNRNSHRPISA